MDQQRHIIVGTAGHVDHGKTELTAALTGVNTDRLPEEKKRGMTIVPGFVPLDLPNGQRLGLIDVPGHERFVKNMLAGVAGVDMALLVVAADEGVMPQTVEHLHILDLLGVDKGLVAITKSDLADAEWLELISEQTRELLQGTHLAQAPIIPCSARSGAGLQQLLEQLTALAEQVREKPLAGRARMPVDRVFTKEGFGTVVTGTLWAGSLRNGEKVQLWPSGIEARIRGLQVHNQPTEQAWAGQRTAVNLAGLDKESAPRGGWLAEPGLLRESYRLDISLDLLQDAKALARRERLRIHHGATEALGRIELLDREEAQPGSSCYAQLVLENPLPPLNGDRLILRSYSPALTIGGATVLDAAAPRHKRYQPAVLEALAGRCGGDALAPLLSVLERQNTPPTLSALAAAAQQRPEEIAPLLEQGIAEGRILALSLEKTPSYISAESLERYWRAAEPHLRAYQQRWPLRRGCPLPELKARILPGFNQKQLNALLELWRQRGYIDNSPLSVATADHSPQPDQRQSQLAQRILELYQSQRFMPAETAEMAAQLQLSAEEMNELCGWLAEQGQLAKGGEYWFARSALQEAEQLLRPLAAQGLSVSAARDALESSRKYVLPLLECLENSGLLRRINDLRYFQ